jgi:hypothetical protein
MGRSIKNYRELTSIGDWEKLFELLDSNAHKSKKLFEAGVNLHQYKALVESKNYSKLLNRKVENEVDLITAMCIAYSWMPTMLDIHGTENEIKVLANEIADVNTIDLCSDEEKRMIFSLARITNNSIVGAIKTLHLIDSERYPLIDSRVLIGWKKLLLMVGDEFSIGKIGYSLEVGRKQEHLNKLIDKYFYYRSFINDWVSNLANGTSVRDIEFRLYLLGDR